MEALAAAGRSWIGTSHRQAPVRDVVREVRAGLRELFALPDGWEVVLGNGGSTAFWDVATFGLIERRSQHLVFGEFSGKFADAAAAAPHLDAPEIIRSEPGTHPAPVADAGVDVYALTHNETSTGVMMALRGRPEGDGARRGRRDVGRRRAAVVPGRGRRLLLRAAEVLRLRRWPVAGAAAPPRRVERIERIAASGRWVPASLDLRIALENSRADQTYNTPALATLFLLADQLRWMLGNGGLAWCVARSAAVGRAILYGWAEARAYAHAVRRRPGRAVDGRRHHRPRRASTPRRCPPSCAPTASSTPTPTASWGATSSASGCSRRSTPTTSRR